MVGSNREFCLFYFCNEETRTDFFHLQGLCVGKISEECVVDMKFCLNFGLIVKGGTVFRPLKIKHSLLPSLAMQLIDFR